MRLLHIILQIHFSVINLRLISKGKIAHSVSITTMGDVLKAPIALLITRFCIRLNLFWIFDHKGNNNNLANL